MKHLLTTIACVLVTLFTTNSNGQNKYPSDNRNAIILQDSNDITISGKKAGFIYFHVERKIKVKIISTKGKDLYANILLPETFDPSYIYHNADIRNPNNCFSGIKLIQFEGTIKKFDGKTVKAQINQTINTVTSVGSNDFFVYYDQPKISITNLDTGDILSLQYSYEMPYNENFEKVTSFRIFFNGVNDKVDYNLHLSCDDGLNLKIKYFNNANPDTIVIAEQLTNYTWHLSNLAGSIDEAGGRPYTELPYILITIKPSALIYELPYSFEERYIPLYAIAASIKESSILGVLKATDQGVKNKSYIAIDNFIREHTQTITGDSLGYVKLVTIHNFIVDEFDYDSDTTYFKKEDLRKERIGEYVANHTIRELSRYTMYASLISKLDLGFYTAYVADTRVGIISDEFVSPMFDNDFLIAAVLKNNTLQLIYPKRSKFGYYIDEVPFYYENTTARLVSLDDYQDMKSQINEGFRKMNTPTSSFNDNDRKSNVLVTSDLDNLTTTFTAKISLKGQYSTLMRGQYLYGSMDKSINELYGVKIYEINPNVKLIQKEVNIVQKVFPFKTDVKLVYTCDSLIKKIGENQYSLNTMNWFRHIIYNDIESGSRNLNYFPDFKGKDTYSYIVTFSKNIEIVKPIENINIENDFGTLIITCSQNQPNSIMISSYFLTKTDKIPADKISQVQSIFAKIQELNNQSIVFKTTD